MNLWQKLTMGIKFIFGGFEAATDYLLNLLNGWLSAPDVAEKVAYYYGKAKGVYDFLVKYQRFCPAAWTEAYAETLAAVKQLVDVFADGKVEEQEIKNCIAAFKAAYEKWMHG